MAVQVTVVTPMGQCVVESAGVHVTGAAKPFGDWAVGGVKVVVAPVASVASTDTLVTAANDGPVGGGGGGPTGDIWIHG